MEEDTIYQQMSIFAELYELKKIKKPIRLIELFSGIGSQFKALKQITSNVESYKICEWAYKSYSMYNLIHIKDNYDYSKDLTEEQLIEKVRGTSWDYNKPMTDAELKRKGIEWLRKAYNNIKATHNLVDIMRVKGKDLEIVDTDKYEYILTYSFPCQDLSMSGKRLGMAVSQADGGTRSGLLWEVERILAERERESLPLPQILFMENVPEVCGTKNVRHFEKWQDRLSQFGYKSYCEILNAKDYGIPQNRKRCYMISILGDYAYEFPRKLKLEYKLKDLLEHNVDEKYFLSKKMIDFITTENEKHQGSLQPALVNKSVSQTITTREGNTRCQESNYICNDLPENADLKQYNNKALNETLENNEIEDGDFIDAYNRDVKKDIAGTITTGVSSRNETFIGTYDYAQSDTLRPNQEKRTHIGNNISGTILASNNQNGIIVGTLKEELCNDLIKQGKVKEGDIVKHSFTTQIMSGNKKCVEKSDEMITLTTCGDCFGVCVKRYENYISRKNNKGEFNTQCNRASLENDLALTIPTKDQNKVLQNDLRIRKLTPSECLKLMAFEQKDYDAVKEQFNDMCIYHCAGDSIVVSVIIALMSSLILEQDSHIKIIQDYVKGIVNGNDN